VLYVREKKWPAARARDGESYLGGCLALQLIQCVLQVRLAVRARPLCAGQVLQGVGQCRLGTLLVGRHLLQVAVRRGLGGDQRVAPLLLVVQRGRGLLFRPLQVPRLRLHMHHTTGKCVHLRGVLTAPGLERRELRLRAGPLCVGSQQLVFQRGQLRLQGVGVAGGPAVLVLQQRQGALAVPCRAQHRRAFLPAQKMVVYTG